MLVWSCIVSFDVIINDMTQSFEHYQSGYWAYPLHAKHLVRHLVRGRNEATTALLSTDENLTLTLATYCRQSSLALQYNRPTTNKYALAIGECITKLRLVLRPPELGGCHVVLRRGFDASTGND